MEREQLNMRSIGGVVCKLSIVQLVLLCDHSISNPFLIILLQINPQNYAKLGHVLWSIIGLRNKCYHHPKIDLVPHFEDAWRIFHCWLFGFDFFFLLHKSTMHAPKICMIKNISPQINPLNIPVIFDEKLYFLAKWPKYPFDHSKP